MIVNILRRAGDSAVLERVDGDLLFEGGAAEEGVLATFHLDGREVTGRVVHVGEAAEGAHDAGSIVEIVLIDAPGHDVESKITLANLPPGDETGTKI